MKLTTLLILAAFLQVSAATFAQKVTYKGNKVTLEQMIKEIRKQTGYNVLASASKIDKIPAKAVDFKDTPVLQVLQTFLDDQPLTFVIDGQTIVIKDKDQKKTEQTNPPPPPPVTVTGNVENELGEPMAGVTVKQKTNPTIGTVSDAKGNYTLTVPNENTVIVFSFIGYESQELQAKDIPTGSVIALKVAEGNLKEVVINKGYYDEKRELSTGDVTVVSAKTIEQQPVSDPILALEGRVPGMQISQTSGMPGASYTIYIRGQNSILNGNTPLYIVDGVPVLGTSLTSPYIGGGAVGTPFSPLNPSFVQGAGLSPFNSLNPEDIESIEILKDADATSIYGSRGANGVVLITTKKGKAGQTRVDIDVNSGVGNVTRMPQLLNLQQYLDMRHTAFQNDGKLPRASDYDINGTWDTTHYTNWEKLLIGNTAHFTTSNVSVSGGNANTQFVLGGGYSDQTTVFAGNYNDQRASAHVNINHNSNNQRFHVLFTAQYSNDDNLLPAGDFTKSIFISPDAPAPFNSDGSINFANGTFTNNPLTNTLQSAQATTENLVSSLNLGYDILPGLKLQSLFGYTRSQMNQSIQSPASVEYGPPVAANRINEIATSTYDSWVVEPKLTYERKISKGKLELLAGATVQRNDYNTLGEFSSGYSSDQLISNVANASTLTLAGSSAGEYRYEALYSRINYDWEDKYVINVTARRDGSSRFGTGNQFGNFGAAGSTWLFSKENFIMKAFPFLSLGKLRASYGTSGNDQIPDYQFLSTYASSGNYQGAAGLAPNRIGNPYYQWEVDKKLEGSLELGFLKDRIDIEADYYRNRSGNQLVGQPLPSQDGFGSIEANLPAVVQNAGWEFQLNTANITGSKFSWRSTFNISFPNNKLVSFPGLQYSVYANSYVVGQSLFDQKLYQFTGVDPQTGLKTYLDANNDGALTSADQGWVFVGQHYYGGLGNTFAYGNLQLDVFFQFADQTARNLFASMPRAGSMGNVPIYYVNGAWQAPGDITDIPKLTAGLGPSGTASYSPISTYDVSDASYIRLKNVSLSYILPRSWQHALSMQNARLYLQAQNLLTFTDYKGFDPETGGESLPPLRMISLGFKGSF